MIQIACWSVTWEFFGIFRTKLARLAIDRRQHGASFSQCHMIGFRARLQDIQLNAVFAFHRLERGTLFVDSVKISQVRCVRGVFHALQPVAVVSFAGLGVASFHHSVAVLHEHVVPGQRRRAFFVFSQVSEHKPAQFLRRIPGMLNVGRGLDRLGRPVDDVAAPVVAPAMIGAANPVGLNNAVLE